MTSNETKRENSQNKPSKQASPYVLNHPERRLRLPDVSAFTGLPTSSIYAKMAAGTFPQCEKISDRASAWRQGDIFEYIKDPTNWRAE